MSARPHYTTVLFDLDHTIFDFDTSEERAFEEALAVVGIDDAVAHLGAYRRLNNALWAAAERGEIRSSQIRNLRFEQLARELELDVDAATVVMMADAFVNGLGHHGDLYPGARDVLDVLVEGATLAVISNGLGEVVYARMARLELSDYFDAVVVSSEIGVAKPSTAIFDAAFERLGAPDKSQSLMVGDSLSSDIAGGTAFGIDTCWYNPHGRVPAETDRFTHQVAALSELPSIVGAGDGEVL
jgi:2-haloacid dehalogenase